MRELLATVILLKLVSASDIGLNLPCNRELDGFLAVDPSGSQSSFLSCQSSGTGPLGYWERKVCPGNMVFDFISQQCREKKLHKQQPTMNIAILNSSCAHGEVCIGGTICDQERFRCLCPYGTIPQLETLSCMKPQSTYYQETPNFSSIGNYERPPPPLGAFTPNPSHSNTMPNFFGPDSLNFISQLFNKENPSPNSHNFNTNSNNGGVPDGVTFEYHGDSGFGHRNGAGTLTPFVFQPNFLPSTTPMTMTNKVPMSAQPSYLPVTNPSSQPPQPIFVPSTTSPPAYTQLPVQPPPSPILPTQPVDGYPPSSFAGHYVQSQNVYTQEPQTNHPSKPYYVNHQTSTTSAPLWSLTKPNQMKISLGGRKQSGVGVQCSLNTDCMIGAYCNGNTRPPTCQCLSTHVSIEERCERVIYPGQVGCRHDLQCAAAHTGASCLNEKCVCIDGSNNVDETCGSGSEPATSPPGGPCTNARKCINGSVCREGWCICPDPTMIVQRGVCIQPGPRPALPTSITSSQPTRSPSSDFRATQNLEGRLVPVTANCGPFDSCAGGATCVDGVCLCPSGTQPSPHGRCEPTAGMTASSTSSVHILSPGSPTYARPGQKCANGEICVAGSYCNENGVCTCSNNSILKGDECVPQHFKRTAIPGESCDENTICTQESSCQSGQCRCQHGFIVVSGKCVALPMPTTLAMKKLVLANPLDSCDNGEQCQGGSSCDLDTGVCMCEPGHIVVGVQCRLPPTNQSTVPLPPSPAQQTSSNTRNALSRLSNSYSSTNDCKNDAGCERNKICVAGRCKCKPDFVDHDGVCKPLEEIDFDERPVPVSYAKHKVETSMSEHVMNLENSNESTTTQITDKRMPLRTDTQRPRLVGPPIRRPRPKPKGSSSSAGGTYKSGPTGTGNCPPGNEATRDDSGRLIMCNGFEPNCPPRSYCYITTGGFASEEYNCCKSW
ncbi:hypothetical protein V3C99_001169 [Haemonchus contortus]